MTIPLRSEYPRPDFIRDSWLSLNGTWDFSFDNDSFNHEIIVPFSYETQLSGLGITEFHNTVWYRRTFTVPATMKGNLLKLHFGAVDYSCQVWVNRALVAMHTGGQTGFSADISGVAFFDCQNTVVVKVTDDHLDMEMPRGKQTWKEAPHSIFYTHTTGIWQSVWLEAVPHEHLSSVRLTPLFDEKAIRIDYNLCGGKDLLLGIDIAFQGTHVASITMQSQSRKGSLTIDLDQTSLQAWNFYEDLAWSPENPRLFDIVFRVYREKELVDTVQSYFGIRKISCENGAVLLNNRPYYLKMILDQGYWPHSMLTAPSDDAFIQDIESVKAMGFNGVRKHQKVEDPRFLYHADRLGLLVWSEIGAAYVYSSEYAVNMYHEWANAVQRDYNHPCIIAWVPLNESWGVQEIHSSSLQQEHSKALYHMTKSLDNTRIVMDNDGWEHVCGDLLTIHDYESNPDILAERYHTLKNILDYLPNGKQLFIGTRTYASEPIIVSEFGGICFGDAPSQMDVWGYSEAHTADEFFTHLDKLMQALQRSAFVQGYCYTQLTDVGAEQNGLLDYNHEPKFPLALIRQINEGKFTRHLKSEEA